MTAAGPPPAPLGSGPCRPARKDGRALTAPPTSRERPVCLAASPGGHLAELQAVAGAFAGRRRVWVTGASGQAEALRAAGEEARVLPAWGRDPPGLRGFPPNVRAATGLVRALRPALVVTTGAGLVVPFALAARLAGSELVLVESMARVLDASLTGRILAPLARVVLVQWPEMARVYRRARVCRPALLERRGGDARAAAGRGTFVSVGTRPEPFDRLLAMADRAVTSGALPEPVVAQSGASSYRPVSFSATPWLAPEEVSRAVGAARCVVCHGGAAMVAAAIGAGRRPLVLPRLRARGEHRTEHQAQLVDRLAARGAVVALREEIGEREVRLAAEPWTAPFVGRGVPSVEEALMRETASWP